MALLLWIYGLEQRCLDEVEVLDKVSRLSVDPFQHNRRLSETTLLDLSPSKGGCSALLGSRGNGSQSRSESHSVAQSPPFESTNHSLDLDNPFQNDQLPVWQDQAAACASRTSSTVASTAKISSSVATKSKTFMTPTSEASSPDNNYGGQGRAYCYQNLNETPASPDLVNHRQRDGFLSPPPTPTSAEVIQVTLGLYAISWFYVICSPHSFHSGFSQCRLTILCLRWEERGQQKT